MSRAIFDAPMMLPEPSRIGEIVSETSSRRPSLATRTVSNDSTRCPRRSCSRIACSSSIRSGGTIRVIAWPTASWAVYPNSRSALAFHDRMMPSSVFPTIASEDDSTMAASRALSSSARLRSVTSRKTRTAPMGAPDSPCKGAALSSMGRSDPSRAMRRVVVGQPDDHPLLQGTQSGALDWLASSFVDNVEDFGQGAAHRLGLGPAGQHLGHAVHERDPALGVGADHRVADAGKSNLQPLRLLPQLLFGATARQKDALGILQGDSSEPLFLFFCRHDEPLSFSQASAVPSTLARIFANAVSRLFVSSQKGENPQSSQVPSCSTGMSFAASKIRSRISEPIPSAGLCRPT